MKTFVKGVVKSKLFQTEGGDLTIQIEKTYDKAEKKGNVCLKVESPCGCTKACFCSEVSTRVFNKVDPTLFEALAAQLEKGKNFGKLVIK
jgi:hypothetical protein